MTTKLFFGSDHAGYDLKNALIAYVRETFPSFEPVDLGTHSKDSVDYPIFGHSVGKAVVQEHSKGVVVCGTGIGISIAANKVPGVRCALCHDVTTAKLCREHNDANVLSIGARIVGLEVAKDILSAFLTTPASTQGRHKARIELIEKLE